MKTPSFWFQSGYRPNLLLRCAAALYGFGRAIHVRMTSPVLPALPTICVGNLIAGGAGKTPVVRALYHLIGSHDTMMMTRGYGGRKTGPAYVHVDDTVRDVGDEALLLARTGPCVIARDRCLGIDFIARNSGRLVIMDDGLQNRKIYPHLNILVIDGAVGFGNGHLIPAGPLREPIADALARTDIIILIGDDMRGVTRTIHSHIPVFTARAVFDTSVLNKTKPYVAFAGLARPQKFFDALTHLGAPPVATRSFADHHVYSAHNLNDLVLLAGQHRAQLITTEKDAVKLPADMLANGTIQVLPMGIAFDTPEHLKSAIFEKLKDRTTP